MQPRLHVVRTRGRFSTFADVARKPLLARRHLRADRQAWQSCPGPVSETPREDKTLAGFARWCFLHRKTVLAVWLIALIGFIGVSRLTGSAFSNGASLPGTDSAKALQVLTKDFPAQAGDSDQIVVQARHGTLRSAAARAAVTAMLARVARPADVRSAVTPYGTGGQN